MFRRLKSTLNVPVYLHSMPGKNEPWVDFVTACHREKISEILSLTSLQEIAGQSNAYAQAIEQQNLPARLHICAIPDYSTPIENTEYQKMLSELSLKVLSGAPLLIHCAGGIGRTGLSACCLLKEFGLSTEEAIAAVEASGSKAERPEQRAFIENYQAQASEK